MALNIQEIIEYYVNLLIIQYHDQPNAQAEIRLLIDVLYADGILLDIQDAYNVDTAVGKQLDVIGKYVGVDRVYSNVTLTDMFSFITYDIVTAPPSSPPRFGFSLYTTFNNYQYNGTLIYDDIIAKDNALTDENYRVLIKLAIIINASNFSSKQIDDALFEFFGTTIRAEDAGDMHMIFYITSTLTPLIQAIVAKGLLPTPMGVGALIVSNIEDTMFSFTDYSGYESPYGYGFSDYSDYATLPGQDLTYDQLSRG